jgi:hypothetical protein
MPSWTERGAGEATEQRGHDRKSNAAARDWIGEYMGKLALAHMLKRE